MKPVKLPKPTENEIVKVIRDYAVLRFGIELHRIRENPWTSEPGLPDLFGHYKGRAIFIEVKREGGKRRQAQIAFIKSAAENGAIAFFADSLESFVDGMGEFGIYGKNGQKSENVKDGK